MSSVCDTSTLLYFKLLNLNMILDFSYYAHFTRKSRFSKEKRNSCDDIPVLRSFGIFRDPLSVSPDILRTFEPEFDLRLFLTTPRFLGVPIFQRKLLFRAVSTFREI